MARHDDREADNRKGWTMKRYGQDYWNYMVECENGPYADAEEALAEIAELKSTYESCNRARQEAERVCAEQKAIITCNESVLSLIDRVEKELAKCEDEEVLYPGRFGTIVWMRDEITKQRATIAELVAAGRKVTFLVEHKLFEINHKEVEALNAAIAKAEGNDANTGGAE